ncbi:MAG TPA: hypothetical protein VHM66_01980 [Solirubrobacterales bacterium]|nr:hypothetical protein [Solirubrobacterales bacterium]
MARPTASSSAAPLKRSGVQTAAPASCRAGDRAQLWEAHKYGAEREYSQIEKLCNLASIPRPHGFQVFAMPVLIEGASTGWARVVALIEIEQG